LLAAYVQKETEISGKPGSVRKSRHAMKNKLILLIPLGGHFGKSTCPLRKKKYLAWTDRRVEVLCPAATCMDTVMTDRVNIKIYLACLSFLAVSLPPAFCRLFSYQLVSCLLAFFL